MITWFSAGAHRARRACLGLGLLTGLLAGGAARAQEAAASSAKVREKKDLSEARLAAARAKAGAGRVVDAQALYGQALAAGLAAEAQAVAAAAAPRPTSVTSLANEQPVEEAPAAAAPSEAEVAAEAQRAAEQERAARAEASAREQRDEEARRAAERQPALAAPPVVVALAPEPPRSPPLAFEAGVRSALTAKNQDGTKHAGLGLVFSWLTLATPYGRGAFVVDLESTRLQPGRNDKMDREQVAFYGLGFDWTVPFASHGTGLFVGAEAAGGVLQSSTMATTTVATDGVLQIMPHAGGAVSYRGVGLFVDAGWRFQLLADSATSGQASTGGVVLQGGLRVEMQPGDTRETDGLTVGAFDLGYAARFYSPNGSRIYSRYGGVFGADSGPLVQHELLLTTSAYLPRALHMEQGLALTYLGAGQDGGGTALSMVGLGWLGTWHAFATQQLFNPYLGLRLGFVVISSGDATTFEYKRQAAFMASGMAGVDVAVLRRLALRLGVAYDAIDNGNNVANASLSGYAIEAGVIVRL